MCRHKQSTCTHTHKHTNGMNYSQVSDCIASCDFFFKKCKRINFCSRVTEAESTTCSSLFDLLSSSSSPCFLHLRYIYIYAYKYVWITSSEAHLSFSVSAAVMNTHFNKSTSYKAIFHTCSTAVGRQAHIKEVYPPWKLPSAFLTGATDIINCYFVFENSEFHWLPESHPSASQSSLTHGAGLAVLFCSISSRVAKKAERLPENDLI